jgi:nicotinamidase/pyrazinamidase
MDEMRLTNGDVLIMVDVQNDFLPGGALEVAQSDEVIEPLNRASGLFHQHGLPVFATRDWHPRDHCSFLAQGGPWPPHCIQDTPGAEFSEALQLPRETIVLSKGTLQDRDTYSDFQETELHELLQRLGVKRLFVGGLATDYCIVNTVKDGLANGYEVYVLSDAIRAVNLKPGDGQRAIEEMRSKGAKFVELFRNETGERLAV